MQRLILIAALLVTSPTFCQTEPTELTGKDAYARPLLILSPTFPAGVDLASLPIELRVTGTVTTEGIFKAPVFSPSEGKAPYIQSVLDVLPSWRFRPALDNHLCQTKESQALMIVYFEIKEGKPTIFISSPKISESDDDVKPESHRQSFVIRPKYEYPVSMLERGIEGSTEVILKVDRDGEIIAKHIIYSIPKSDFGEAVLSALKWKRFTKALTSSVPETCYTYYVTFCVEGDNADFHEPRCHRGKKSK